MSELYGFQAGQRIAQNDSMVQQMNQLSMEDKQVAIESSRMALDSQKKMISLMQGVGSGIAPGGTPGKVPDTTDLSTTLNQLAQTAVAAGLPEQARKYAATASTLQSNQTKIDTAETTAQIKKAGVTANLMKDVNDQAGFDQAIASFSLMFGERSRFAGMKYSPELKQKLMDATTTIKQQAETKAALAREKSSTASAAESTVRQDLIRAQTAVAEQRKKILEKTGGKAPGVAPKASSVRAITDRIASKYTSFPAEEQRVMAGPIAERMEELVFKGNKTPAEAADQAFTEAEADQTFGGAKESRALGGTKDKPYDVASVAGDKTKLKKNMYYTLKDGRVALWTGDAFQAPKK